MKRRISIAVFLLLLVVVPVALAQCEGFCTYLPIIFDDGCGDVEDLPMSDFKIVVPEATTNYCLNPSAETTGNFTAEAGTTVTRVTTYQKYGLYSYRVQSNADNEGVELTLSALTNNIHYVTMRVAGTLPTTWDWSLDDATFNQPTSLGAIDATWTLYGFEFPAAQANGSTKLSIHQNGAGSGDFYLDGIQVEQKDDYYTTYCDGTQGGCEWNGAKHASTSTRSALSRAGGRVKDLQTDYSFDIGGAQGTGMTTLDIGVDEYALLPGGELNSIKEKYRVLTITGTIRGTSVSNLHSKRQALINVLSKDAVPEDASGYQPVRLRYTGAAVQKEIAVHYDDGLQFDIRADQDIGVCSERLVISFLADDPYWYEIGNSAVELDTNDSITVYSVTARFKDTGQWDNLGPPNASGTYSEIRAIAEDSTYVYLGGDFQNFDNIANADYIVRYNKQTDTWSALGSGMDDEVWALAIGPDGTLYAGGLFTTAGGGAASRIASWNGSSWSALGSGTDDNVYALTVGLDDTLYAGGNFANAGGGAASYVASWDGSSWSALGPGTNDTIYALTIGLDGTLYAGGEFTTAGGSSANYIASWNGTAWSALSTGMNDNVRTLAVSLDGTLYAGGEFTTAGGSTVNYITSWNGTAWSALGSGMNHDVYYIDIGDDDVVYVAGQFTTAGSVNITGYVALWNGASWAHLDISLPNFLVAYIAHTGKSDAVIKSNYDIWLAGSTPGPSYTAYIAGTATATNSGTSPISPVVMFYRSGGTSATIKTLRNEETGKSLWFDYDLVDGETLTVDLTPQTKNITSSFFGQRFDAMLANSDFGDFTLLAGDNDTTSFIDVSGAPTITAWMQWRTAYASWD